MAEELRLLYSNDYIEMLANKVAEQHAGFNQKDFVELVLGNGWKDFALKERMYRITESLHQCLALPFADAVSVLKPVSEQFSGFGPMFFPDFVEKYGLEHWDTSMAALEHFTQFSSSEFAVRPFIVKNTERMMAQMLAWSTHGNEHVRRLASEGCRPRLPWAMALPAFKEEPAPILPILHNLMQDDSLYVRKSVANNINDIAKDNPDTVVDIVESKLGEHKHTDWILKHGSRTLLKKAEPRILKLFNLGDTDHLLPTEIQLATDQAANQVKIGSALPFSFTLKTDAPSLGRLRIEYAIHFVKAGGKRSRKVFKITENDFSEQEKTYRRKHSLKQMTTRTHYPGEHLLEVVVNGNVVASQVFRII